MYACGWGADGQTGLGNYENQSVPARVKGDVTSEKIVKVSSAADCVLALNGKTEIRILVIINPSSSSTIYVPTKRHGSLPE